MRKVGAMTCCLNEEATIAFTIGSLIDHVDVYVVVDTGSTDRTLDLIESIFENDILSGKLILVKYGPLHDYDISKPKNVAIRMLKEEGCYNFIRLDGDDVFYDMGAAKSVESARTLNEQIVLYTINHWELYQNIAMTTGEWLSNITCDLIELDDSISIDKNRFWCMRMPPGADPTPNSYPHRFDGSYGHARIYRINGAMSIGKWTDEAWGVGPGEDIHHPGFPRITSGNHDELIVHYGWARPMNKKISKGEIWSGKNKATDDPRINRMENTWGQVKDLNID